MEFAIHANIGDKIAARFLHALGFGEVAQHGNGAASGHGRGGNIDGAPRSDRAGTGGGDDIVVRGFLDGGEKIGIAHAINQRRVQPGRAKQKTVHAAIRPLHTPIGADGDHGVLHAVEERLELILAGLHADKVFFDAPRRAVECSGNLPDFIYRSGGDSGSKVAGGDALGETHDALRRRPRYCEVTAASRRAIPNAMSDPRSNASPNGRSVISISGNG